MARVLIVVGLLALAFAVYAVVDCAMSERARVRALPKAVWILVILVLPVLGGVLWFLIGSGRAARGPAMRYVGPDDDPDFIRGSRPTAAPPVPDDEWRRLEQELAAMDSEADSDDEGDARRR
ncbi:PLD nuclease N-terminal domain-containing protein [Amnibacterium endophyticum]|uniref:PLD nuclease N-terminal domain-containing protein n=1 Tax=Amnibacterium endophyticum TaxID=2109337 RepID=A0ABW4LDG5_9MICO